MGGAETLSAGVCQWYRTPGMGETALATLLARVQKAIPEITGIESECCYNVDLQAPLDAEQAGALEWYVRIVCIESIVCIVCFSCLAGRIQA